MNIKLVGCVLLSFLTVSVRADNISSINDHGGKPGADDNNSSINNKLATFEKVPDIIPGSKMLLSLDYQTLVGLPTQFVSAALKTYCSIALSGGSANGKFTPNIDRLGLLFMKGTVNVTYPLNQPERLLEDPKFDPDLPMIIYCTGFLTNLQKNDIISAVAEESIDVLFRAYTARGGYNFVVLDTGGYISTVRSWAALNTQAIGRFLAQSLVKIVETYPLKNIQLMGHSMGAQIVGAAGYFFHQTTDQFIPRITGLDPANLCFSEGESLSGISRGVADFVDVIHTNNGVLGQKPSVGDVDFYPNGVVAIQPGCLGIVCSHNRAWELYAETIYPGNEKNLLATRCNSLKVLNTNMCRGRRIPMGFACPTNATGNYFLTTRKSSPFGKNFRGL